MKPATTHRIGSAAWRASLPEILSSDDVQTLLRLKSRSGATRSILRGDCGKFVRIGRRLFIRKVEFMRALKKREAI